VNLPFDYHAFPAINATLNALSAVLLVAAYIGVKNFRFKAHGWLMIFAVAVSAAFLVCYVTYHAIKARHGEMVTRFPQSTWRPVYLVILTSHTILAVVILPMIITALVLAYRRSWAWHRRVATPTFFLWLYVSVTGVVVYWMLYHLAPTLQTAAVASAG
jgi:uncharacterized membrane protein YozB (DUF420 family)